MMTSQTPTGAMDGVTSRHRDATLAEPDPGQAVSWGAIFAGAAAAATLSLILLVLGTGLGLSSISPWSNRGTSATAFGIAAVVWIMVTQIMASGMGGYIAGRLRAKWTRVHSDETYFRDTAHGFLAWSVATLLTAGALASVIGSGISAGVQAGASVAGTVATAATTAGAAAAGSAASDMSSGPSAYLMDSLFRRDMNSANTPNAAASAASAASSSGASPTSSTPATSDTQSQVAEVGRIFLNSIRTGALPPEDARYAGSVVAQRTGLSQADAERRVNDTYARAQAKMREAETAAREAADKARKATVYASLWLFISLLSGAFAASLAATYGGRQRDL